MDDSKFKKILYSLGGAFIVVGLIASMTESTVLYAVNVITIMLFSAMYILYLGNNGNRKSPFVSLRLLLITMLFIILQFAVIYKDYGLVNTYFDAIYFSTVTWTTLGYGDITPKGAVRAYAAAQALIGYVYMGLVVAQLFHIVTNNNRSTKNG